MTESLLVGLAALALLGVGAQWLAWRIHLPSILLLLILGVVAGPVTGFVDPDAIFGDLLLPFVSVSVAVILFEGAASLRISEMRRVGGVAFSLVTVGMLTTGALAAAAAYFILDFDPPLAILLGAILVVTGPTVIIPLLLQLRLKEPANSILKWEGIVIDPLGALLAVLVFEALAVGGFESATAVAFQAVVRTVAAGLLFGLAAALIIILALRRDLIPDFLHSPLTLSLVLATFVGANVLQSESGLLAVTVMGFALANQRLAPVRHILEFKEVLRVLLLSVLFILLAARLRFDTLLDQGWEALAFFAVLVVVVRPVSVYLSTLGAKLGTRERAFLASMAPRGVVAAAISSIFALRLSERGIPGGERLVPITFIVIFGSVALYGLAAPPLARALKLADPNPQGVIIVGGTPFALALAKVLNDQEFRVQIVDTNRHHVRAARLAELKTHQMSINSDEAREALDLYGVGRLLALTGNDEVNALACQHFRDVFGRARVYQLAPESAGDVKSRGVAHELVGKILFGPQATFGMLEGRIAAGSVVKATRLSNQFGYREFQALYGKTLVPLFLVTEEGQLFAFLETYRPTPSSGQTIIALVDPPKEEAPPRPAAPAPKPPVPPPAPPSDPKE